LSLQGFNSKSLNIIAKLRDWSKRKAKFDKNYPQLPIIKINIKKWSTAEQLSCIESRVKLHIEAENNEVPICSDKERWNKGDIYAVMKKGNKRSVKNFTDLKED